MVNEKGVSIAEAWDGTNLKMTFRRNISVQLMTLWEVLVVAIAGSISYSDADDALIWELNFRGTSISCRA